MTDTAPTADAVLLAKPIPRISSAVRWLLFVALAAFFVEVILRPVFTIGLVAAVLGMGLEAGVLRDMGALDPKNFDETFGLGLVVPFLAITAGVGWRSFRWVGARYFKAEPLPATRPTQVTLLTVGLLAFVCFVLFPMNRAHFVDSDGALVGAGLIATDVFVCWLVGWATVRVAWWCVTRVWSACQTRPVLAGMVIVLAGMPAFGIWAADHLLAALIESASPSASQAQVALQESESTESYRQLFLKAAEVDTAVTTAMAAPAGRTGSGSSGGNTLFGLPGGAGDGDDPFHVCVNELHRKPPLPSAVQQARAYYDADLVQDTIVAVCLRERKARLSELRPYFFKALSNSRSQHERRRLRRCEIEEGWSSCRVRYPEETAYAAEHASVERMMCGLSSQEQTALLLSTFEELQAPEIAERMGISAVYVRRLLSDARRKLRDRFAEECE